MTYEYEMAQAQEKKRYQLLNEVYDLTVQLTEAIDRGDRTSVAMLLSMRQEPILSMQEIDENQKRLIAQLTGESDQLRMLQLLQGDSPEAQEAGAQSLCTQIAQNRRLLSKLVALDQRANKRLAAIK